MQATLTALVAKAQTELAGLTARPALEAAKARYVGPNGELTALMKQMGAVPKEQRPAFGKRHGQGAIDGGDAKPFPVHAP